MSTAQAKLTAALKKKSNDDDEQARPPLASSEPTFAPSTLKLKKSNLLGAVSWEEMVEKLALNGKHDFATVSRAIYSSRPLPDVCTAGRSGARETR